MDGNRRALMALLSGLCLVTTIDSGRATAAPPEEMAQTVRPLRFRVVNAGPHRIRAVHVSPSNTPGWGPNLLGRGVEAQQSHALMTDGLKPGARVEVAVTGECGLYDVRLVAEKGMEFIEEEVELCADGDVVTIGNAEVTRLKANRSDRQPK